MTMEGASNVAEFLLQGKDASRVALHMLDGECTYGELERSALRVARHLRRGPSVKGDRILLIADNGPFWVASYLGILHAGRVAVPLPPGTPPDGLEFIRNSIAPTAAFVQAVVFARNATGLAGLDVVTDAPPRDWKSLAGPPAGERMLPSASAGDLAALMFTSGSTGTPRGVMISHANIIANTESIVAYLGLTGNDRILDVLPFHYCFGASLLHTHLRVGGSVVVDSRFMYPEVVLDRMRETRCTGFAGVPSHFEILLRSSTLRKRSFPDLRYVQQAGGCLATRHISDLRQALPEARIFVMYGQTEATARLSYLPPEYLESKTGSVGKGIPGVRLRVLNERGLEVRPGEVGEIVATGANVARGYWGAPQESAATFRNHWLYTGDLATVDADGFLYIVDRAKDFLKCRGERVSCRQIEETLLSCGSLAEAAVVGVPDDVLGEAVKAVVVPRDPECGDVTGNLLQFCRKRLPPHLVPKKISVVASLPRNGAGKVLKARLRSSYEMDTSYAE